MTSRDGRTHSTPTDSNDTMTDRPIDEPSDAELAAIDALLADASVWAEPPPGLEDDIVAAITAEAPSTVGEASVDVATMPTEPSTSAVVRPISSARRWVGPIVAGVAAAVVILVGAAVIGGDDDPTGGTLVALAATELAPDAVATARVNDTPLGTRIDLDVSGLPPAPPGTYYEAWLRTGPDVGVSAGTFHSRGGDGSIELWAGVSADDFPLFTVTLQDEGQSASSGVVVLRGTVEPGP